MASYHRVIGIDLGTTYSVVAAYDHDRQDVRVIPNRQNEPTTPSVVYLSPQGHIKIGKPAKKQIARHPESVIFEVKRIMGEAAATGKKQMVTASGKEYDPEFISAAILKELKACAERIIDAPIHDAVITVPAYFTETQKNATREAAKVARINPRLIINEPTAAAVAYGLESDEPQTFIVYDIGGGTFDVSVVRIEDVTTGTVEVLGTGGNSNLGGGDIDTEIIQWAFRKMREQHGRDFTDDSRLEGRLRLAAEDLKIGICNERAPQELYLENPTAELDEITYILTPEEFDAMARPLLARTLSEVDVALESASKNHDLCLDDVEAIILVGGSSKIPLIRTMLKDKYRKPVKADLNPDEIVAMGAARMALNYDPSMAAEVHDDQALQIDASAAGTSGGLDAQNIKDVVSHTLGVGLKDDIYDPLIPKDHVIPHRIVRGGYTTGHDNQTQIHVPVYQGSDPRASANTLLGEVVIDDLTPEPKGTHQFQITFALDADGIFEGEVLHVQTGNTKPIKLTHDTRLTEKKRLELAALLDTGSASSSSAPNPIAAIEQQAREVMPTLAAGQQRDLHAALDELSQARATGSHERVGAVVARLTMLVSRADR